MPTSVPGTTVSGTTVSGTAVSGTASRRVERAATVEMLRRSTVAHSREESLQAILQVCQEFIGGDVSTIMIYEADLDMLIGVARSDEPYNANGYFQLPLREASLTGLAFRDRRVVAIEDVQNDPRVCQRVRGYFAAKSGIAAPLVIDGEALGAILSMNQGQMRSYSPGDLELMAALGTHAARLLYADLLLERHAVAEDRFQRLLKQAPIPIFLLDTEQRILDCNDAAQRFAARSVDALRGTALDELAHPSARCALRDQIASLSDGCETSFDSAFALADGSPLTVALDASRCRYARSSIVQVFVRDVHHERQLAAEMKQLATYDVLTGLLNRQAFERTMASAIDDARSRGTSHSLLYIDLDQFKLVNDSCGHSAGDALLKQAAEILRSHTRETDAAARLGGDEFAVILRDCTEEVARQRAERIRQAMSMLRLVWNGRTLGIGASIGVIAIAPDASGATDDELLRLMAAVDSACYVAKDQGRNRVQVYRSDDAALRQHRSEVQWTQRLREGIDRDRFALVAQPIVDLATGRVAMHEILLRLSCPNGESYAPGAFLPAAERFGLVAEIDRWVVRRAFRYIASTELIDADDTTLFCINISGLTFGDRDFVPLVEQALFEYGPTPARICFEITESAAMRSLGDATRTIEKLRASGFRVALDDFGKGFCSFGQLKYLPVDYLKLDGSFVRNLGADPVDLAMVESFHNIGTLLGLRTIAEHVEDANALTVLKGLGVHYAQGHHIGSPRALATPAG